MLPQLSVLRRLPQFGCRFLAWILALEVFGLTIFVSVGGVILQAPAQPPVPADLIVVLGGGSMSARLKKGADLYRQGLASRILVTGFSEESLAIVEWQADWRFRYLQGIGVPAEAILKDSRARNSGEEARSIAMLMQEKQWGAVLIVSDPPHLARLAWILGKVLQPTQIRYRLIASNPTWWNAPLWWTNPVSAAFVIEEYIKIVYYLATYKP